MKTYAKGSFANSTNVRLDSDVDIAVEFTEIFYYELIDDLTGHPPSDAGLSGSAAIGSFSGPQGPAELKSAVEGALLRVFGGAAVSHGNKCLKLRESSRSLAADIVPCFTYRQYWARQQFRQGTRIFPDLGFPIHNWPQQHYDNGVAKSSRTGRRFKGMVRALKRLENEMVDKNAADEVPSYLLKCLVFNVDDQCFGQRNLYDDFRCVIGQIFNGTLADERCKEWVEVNGIKYLFRSGQPWTREQAHAFADQAWDYVGFKE